MKEPICEDCEGEGHKDDMIEVDGKYFCPVTHHRIWTEDEIEEMEPEEQAIAERERIRVSGYKKRTIKVPIYEIYVEPAKENAA